MVLLLWSEGWLVDGGDGGDDGGGGCECWRLDLRYEDDEKELSW